MGEPKFNTFAFEQLKKRLTRNTWFYLKYWEELKWSTLATYVLSSGVFGWLIWSEVSDGIESWEGYVALLAGSAAVLYIVWTVIESVFGVVTIQRDGFQFRSPFRKVELKLKDIDSFIPLNGRDIRFLPKELKKGFGVKIPFYAQGARDLIHWSFESTQLPSQPRPSWFFAAVLDLIEGDPVPPEKIGANEEEQKKALENGHQTAGMIKLWTLASCIVTSIYDLQPPQFVMFSLFLLPLVSIAAAALHRPVIRVTSLGGSLGGSVGGFDFPNVGVGIGISSAILTLCAGMQFSMVEVKKIFWVWLSIAVVFVVALRWAEGQTRRQVASFVTASFFAVLYGYGGALCLNAWLDRSAPERFEVRVLQKTKKLRLDKWISLDTTDFLLKLDTPTPKLPPTLEVSAKLFEKINPGDTLRVDVYPGRFEAQYFEISHGEP